MENVTISGNSANNHGGGFFSEDNCNPSLKNVTIIDNSAGHDGGGIYARFSVLSLENVTISGNSAERNGGGIYFWNNSNPILKNVTMIDNTALGIGGGIFCYQNCNPSLVCVTIADNSAEFGGGIYCLRNSNPSLTNCIMWNDTPQEVYFGDDWDPNSITIAYSDIQGGEAGIVTNNNGTVNWLEGNIEEDPSFVGTGEHPYSLLEDSPSIEAGIPDTTGLNLSPWDIIGNHRIWDGDGNGSAIIDMGTYEYGAPPYVDIDDNVIVQTPEVFLQQNYPNPFNPTTTISFSAHADSKVGLTIYNIKGQFVKQLVSDQLSVGEHSVIWDGKADNGKSVSSGIYFYKLIVNGKTKAVKKCIMLK